jgi:integrase
MVKELVDRDPTVGVAAQLQQRNEGHCAALTKPADVGALLRAMHGYQGHPYCRAVRKLAPLVFVRRHMPCHAEWAEFDLDSAQWRFTGEKMKMRSQQRHVFRMA